LQILEQLTIHPLTHGEELFSESPQRLLDGEPFDLHTVLVVQLDLEQVLGEQRMMQSLYAQRLIDIYSGIGGIVSTEASCRKRARTSIKIHQSSSPALRLRQPGLRLGQPEQHVNGTVQLDGNR
jgi:hypothetical protein